MQNHIVLMNYIKYYHKDPILHYDISYKILLFIIEMDLYFGDFMADNFTKSFAL